MLKTVWSPQEGSLQSGSLHPAGKSGLHPLRYFSLEPLLKIHRCALITSWLPVNNIGMCIFHSTCCSIVCLSNVALLGRSLWTTLQLKKFVYWQHCERESPGAVLLSGTAGAHPSLGAALPQVLFIDYATLLPMPHCAVRMCQACCSCWLLAELERRCWTVKC